MQSDQIETLGVPVEIENNTNDELKDAKFVENDSKPEQFDRNDDAKARKISNKQENLYDFTEEKDKISDRPSFNLSDNEINDRLFSSQNENYSSSSEEEFNDERHNENSQEKLLSKVKKYKDQIIQLKGENKALQTKIVSIEELCQLYQNQKRNLQNQVKTLNSKNSQLQNEISKLKTENYNNISNNEALIQIQKENKKLREDNQKITDKYYELKIQTRNKQHNRNIEIKEQLLEITRLQTELQKKNDEVENVKKSNDKAIKKLQQEIDDLKMNEKDLLDEIQILERNQKSDSRKLSDEDDSFANNNSNNELKKQNEILKRKNDIISQNYELERIELQTLLEQKEALVKTLTVKLNSRTSTTSSEPKNQIGSSRSMDILRTENKQLKERLLMCTSSNYSAFNQSYLNDKFKAKSSKLNLTIFRQFSKINSKLSTVNSKVSLLQYRLKMIKKRKADPVINQKVYNYHYTPQRSKRFEALI